MSYNGHANYETWAVSMYIDGNYDGEGTCQYFESFFETAISEGKENQETQENVSYYCGDQLESEVETAIYGDGRDDRLTSGIVADLLKSALSEVDWREIAESRVSDAWDRIAV